MKVLLVLVAIFVIASCAPPKYSDKFDNIDVQSILKNDRLLRNHVNCLLDKGKCNPDGQELKSHLAEALKNDCAQCTQKQKDGSKTVIKHLIKNKREWYNELAAKYDKDGAYLAKYANEFKADGIKL